jgi:hypothetical protein
VAVAEGKSPNFYVLPDDIIHVRQTTARFVLLEFLDALKGLFGFGYSLNS